MLKKVFWIVPILLLLFTLYFFYQRSAETATPNAGQDGEKATAAQQNSQAVANKLGDDYEDALQDADEHSDSEAKVSKEESNGIVPDKLSIPSIQVNADVEQVGLTDDGQMGVPSSDEKTALYNGGPKPGETGNAVIDGHVDNYKGPAVFFYLKDLKKGDKIYVQDKKGKKLTFEVTHKKSYPMNDSPIEDIFGYSNQSNLNLITCTGTFDHKHKTHIDRLVVYTKLVNK